MSISANASAVKGCPQEYNGISPGPTVLSTVLKRRFSGRDAVRIAAGVLKVGQIDVAGRRGEDAAKGQRRQIQRPAVAPKPKLAVAIQERQAGTVTVKHRRAVEPKPTSGPLHHKAPPIACVLRVAAGLRC